MTDKPTESNGDKAVKAVKHYLNGAWYWKKKQKILEENIEYLRSQAEKMTTKFQYVPVFGGYEDHRQDVIAKMIDKEKKYLDAVKNCEERVEEIEFFINGLESYQERIVLEYRYIFFVGWLDISCKLHYNLRSVFKIHKNALHHLLDVHQKIVDNGGKPLF